MPKHLRLVAGIALIALLSPERSVQAGTIMNSADFTGTGVLVVDSSSSTTTLPLFAPGSNILSVVASVNVTKSGSGINSDGTVTGGGFTFNSETVLRLTSPSATTVNLVNAGTYSGQNSPPNAELELLIFDDIASTVVGGSQIVAGTFRPVGSLSDFVNEDPTGNWTLFFQDTVGLDPLSVNAWSLTVTTGQIPEPSSLAIFGINAFGLLFVRRQRRQICVE